MQRSEIEQFVAEKVAKFNCVSDNERVVFLTHDGKVYTRGINSFGELGLGDREPRMRASGFVMPEQITSLSNIIDIFSSDHFSFCLDANFKMYAFGHNEFGQLGLGDRDMRDTPQLVSILGEVNIVHIEVNNKSAYFLDDKGCVYFSGRLHDESIHLVPLKILNLPPIKKVYLFSDNVFFLTHEGDVFACGNNNHYQTGLEFCGLIVHPKKVDLPPIVDLGKCRNATIFLAEDGKVYGCGRNQNGLLTMCLNENNEDLAMIHPQLDFQLMQLTLFDDDPVERMSIGGRFNIFQTKSNKIYLHNRFVPCGNKLEDESIDLPEPIIIPVCENKGNYNPQLYVYSNMATFHMYEAGTLVHESCLTFLNEPANWLQRNRLLAAYRNDPELCSFYKNKFSLSNLSKPTAVLPLRTLCTFQLFKMKYKEVASLPNELRVFFSRMI